MSKVKSYIIDGEVVLWCCWHEQFLPEKKFSPAQSRNMCRSCSSKYDRIRTQQIKEEIIDYLGGGCSKCGYNDCIGALDLHHSVSADKDYTWVEIRKMAKYKIKEFIDKERLVLLCSNCHRQEHYNLRKLDYTFGIPDEDCQDAKFGDDDDDTDHL